LDLDLRFMGRKARIFFWLFNLFSKLWHLTIIFFSILLPFICLISAIIHYLVLLSRDISQYVKELQIITLAASMGLRAMSAKNSALAEDAR
jgi:hypothetical protein